MSHSHDTTSKLEPHQLDQVVGGAGQPEQYDMPPCSDPRNQQPQKPGPLPTPIYDPPYTRQH